MKTLLRNDYNNPPIGTLCLRLDFKDSKKIILDSTHKEGYNVEDLFIKLDEENEDIMLSLNTANIITESLLEHNTIYAGVLKPCIQTLSKFAEEQ